jgi:uncharacterized protein YyaL (SSP411 family)
MTTPRHTNRLAGEPSLYLRQHAHNPVDWYPWGEEAFAAARRRDVPIFLSVGYATCYWCHVMERESFEDESIGALLNEHFLPIKVDREERPDVDEIYMTALQALTGGGGWPMNMVLEPASLRPYWGGTYFPPEPRQGMPSFRQTLEHLRQSWHAQRDDVLRQAERLAESVEAHLAPEVESVPLGHEQITQTAEALLRMFDRVHGGFGSRPKFPQPPLLRFLLDVLPRAGDDATRAAVGEALRRSLDRMAAGGIHDHLAGGFHRYSVDERWLVPHFEKMLYDNAQLAEVYAEASSLLDDPHYADVARRTLDYVLREMTDERGTFRSAQDAEVDGREGRSYVWTRQEIIAALSEADGAFALRAFGLDGGANFRDPHHPDEPAANVLRLDDRPEAVASAFGLAPEAFEEQMAAVRDALLLARSNRDQPARDDKVLTAWNGLMIAAMARAGSLLAEPKYVEAAARAAHALLQAEGGLRRCPANAGSDDAPAFLEDYAHLAAGLIALARATADPVWLERAAALVDDADGLFGDAETGAMHDTPAGRTDLFVRPRAVHDGAVPGGVSTMLHDLLDLDELRAPDTPGRPHLERAVRLLDAISQPLLRSPVGSVNSVRALLRLGAVYPQMLAETTSAPTGAATPRAETVRAFADAESIAIGDNEPGLFRLRLEIADGFHINAADPGPGSMGLVGLRVGLVSGSGVRVYAEYPEGETYGADDELRVHTGEVEFRVVIEADASVDWNDPRLGVTYQACTDTECLQPVTIPIAVRVERG